MVTTRHCDYNNNNSIMHQDFSRVFLRSLFATHAHARAWNHLVQTKQTFFFFYMPMWAGTITISGRIHAKPHQYTGNGVERTC